MAAWLAETPHPFAECQKQRANKHVNLDQTTLLKAKTSTPKRTQAWQEAAHTETSHPLDSALRGDSTTPILFDHVFGTHSAQSQSQPIESPFSGEPTEKRNLREQQKKKESRTWMLRPQTATDKARGDAQHSSPPHMDNRRHGNWQIAILELVLGPHSPPSQPRPT